MTDGIKTMIALTDHFEVECHDKYGTLKWRDTIDNLVVNVGLDDVLDNYLRARMHTSEHYVGLTDGTPTPAAGDTMTSHAGWVEVVAYAEAARQLAQWGAVSGQSANNSANKAVFTINADATTLGGCFLCTNSAKSGTAGTLYGVGAFNAGDKTLDASDLLNVTVTANASAT